VSEFKTRLDFSLIVEKMWAYLTIKKLLHEELKTANVLLREELRHDAVKLAIKVSDFPPKLKILLKKQTSFVFEYQVNSTYIS